MIKFNHSKNNEIDFYKNLRKTIVSRVTTATELKKVTFPKTAKTQTVDSKDSRKIV